ncbi:MAG: head decoration protein [Alphaproteobacteria bacterium]|nr:MAG: head decoration protein [Alphaproteobacteria bacterium]
MDRIVETGVGPEFLLSEANNYRSRENIVVAASQTLLAGAVLGLISATALSAFAAAVAGNTGAATITASPPVAGGTPAGVYKLTAVSSGAAAEFLLTNPKGEVLGNVTTGVAATLGGIGPFTITDAGTDPAIGDQFTIRVAEWQGQYVKHDPEGTNGSQVVAGILYNNVTTSVGETEAAVAIVRDAEVIGSRLVWDDHDAGEKTAAIAALKTMGVITRL